MKQLVVFFTVILLSGKIYSQAPVSTGREVSGIVKDSIDNAVIGAIVVLTTGTDSVKKTTNTNGVFVFKGIKSGKFTISVRSIGYATFNKRFLYNDGTSKLVLDPIILKESSNLLNTVTINGAPPITYKEDTVEYRASDYVVKPNATVDELLKKMEGVEVGTDGTVTHQGVQVQKARINGKDYAGGDVANAIQNLPADILEKVQFVDDFGNEAARTGIKDGDPTKVLNMVTRKDRSVGNTGRLYAGLGNNERYGSSIAGTRLNGNQQITANFNLNNTVTGVAGSSEGTVGGGGFGGSGQGGSRRQGGPVGSGSGAGFGGSSIGGANSGSGGINQTGGGSVGFRDQFGKKLSLNASYSYRFTDNTSENNSVSERYSTLGTTFLTTNNQSEQGSRNNTINFDVEYDIDSANFLRVSPNFSFNTSLNRSLNNEAKTGLQYRTDIGNNTSKSTTPSLGGTVIYQHQFKKQGRNISFNISSTSNSPETDTDVNTNILFYDAATDDLTKDSLVQRLVMRKNLTNVNSGSFTFSEPLIKNQTTTARLQFNASISRSQYDNTRFTDNVNNSGDPVRIDSLSNIFNYSFTTTRLGLNYNLMKTKSNGARYGGSFGVTLVPSVLEGTKEHLNISLRKTNLTFIPIANLQYQFSRTHRLNIRYNGRPQEPSFDQIQPVRDDTDPNNPKVGNPDLKVAFRHGITTSYNNYIANKALTLYATVTGTTNPRQVTTNLVEYFDADSILIRETRYLNLNGAHNVSGSYGISKNLANRKYKLELSGTVGYTRGVSMSNNLLNFSDRWNFVERLAVQINPNSWLELNPNISYNTSRTDFTLATSTNNLTRTLAISGDGRVHILKKNVLNFSARKNFVSGINANVTNNPFVINTSIERQFFKRNNGALAIQAFDILNQNNFVTRDINENGFTDVKSNALSRYFMISFRWTPQKWTGTPNKGGRQLNRRGDGSFME